MKKKILSTITILALAVGMVISASAASSSYMSSFGLKPPGGGGTADSDVKNKNTATGTAAQVLLSGFTGSTTNPVYVKVIKSSNYVTASSVRTYTRLLSGTYPINYLSGYGDIYVSYQLRAYTSTTSTQSGNVAGTWQP